MVQRKLEHQPAEAEYFIHLDYNIPIIATNMVQPRKGLKRRNQRRGSLEILRETIAPSISKTARAAATQTKHLLRRVSVVFKTSVGEAPAVIHSHPERARRNSRYSEKFAFYNDGWGAGAVRNILESTEAPG